MELYDNPKEISFDNGYGTTYVFKVTDKIPDSTYMVWNIGDHMVNGYLPLCKLVPDQEDWQKNIDTASLLAIDFRDKPELLAKLREASRYGVDNLAHCKARSMPIRRPTSDWRLKAQGLAKELVPVFESLSDFAKEKPVKAPSKDIER